MEHDYLVYPVQELRRKGLLQLPHHGFPHALIGKGLAFAAEAAELSAVYGDYGGRFYNSLESSAEKFLNYAKLHPDFFSLHETEFENLISTADPLGYGVSDDLGYMMENVRIELGYYDDPDGDK